jgi:hypothetical protein
MQDEILEFRQALDEVKKNKTEPIDIGKPAQNPWML